MWAKLVKLLWQRGEVHGLELLFDTLLLLLRYLSLSYWLRNFLPDPSDSNHNTRDNAIDIYCVVQLFIILLLSFVGVWPPADFVIASYFLFEIYLNLFNIVFLGKFPWINAPPASVERSILLLFVNVLQIVFAFGVFYRHLLKLSPTEGFFKAVLVLGTLGYPEATGACTLVVAFQVLLDFVLVVLVFSGFAGQVGLFKEHGASGASGPSKEEK